MVLLSFISFFFLSFFSAYFFKCRRMVRLLLLSLSFSAPYFFVCLLNCPSFTPPPPPPPPSLFLPFSAPYLFVCSLNCPSFHPPTLSLSLSLASLPPLLTTPLRGPSSLPSFFLLRERAPQDPSPSTLPLHRQAGYHHNTTTSGQGDLLCFASHSCPVPTTFFFTGWGEGRGGKEGRGRR